MIPGDLVVSGKGRDKGRMMFVIGRAVSGSLLVADGRLRRVERPKLKCEKHLALVSSHEGNVTEKIRRGEKVTNAELRRAIAGLRNE